MIPVSWNFASDLCVRCKNVSVTNACKHLYHEGARIVHGNRHFFEYRLNWTNKFYVYSDLFKDLADAFYMVSGNFIARFFVQIEAQVVKMDKKYMFDNLGDIRHCWPYTSRLVYT